MENVKIRPLGRLKSSSDIKMVSEKKGTKEKFSSETKKTKDKKNKYIFTMAVLLLLIVVIGIISLIIWAFTHKNAYQIYMGNVSIGILQEEVMTQDLYNTAVAQLEAKEGTKIKVNNVPIFNTEFVRADKEDFITAENMITKIKNSLTYTVQAYSISVDGTQIGILNDENVINKVLDRILADYDVENAEIVEKSFVEEVKIEPVFVDREVIIEEEDLYKKLTTTVEVAKLYTVKKGDSFWKIANDNGLTLVEMMKVNPDINVDILQIGQELVLTVPKPLLSVKVVTRIKYTESIPQTVIYETDASQYKTYKKTRQQGQPGSQEVTANIIYINGYEEDREIVGEPVVIQEPVADIIVTGTKALPAKAATGSFGRPISGGTISSYFGQRWGELHQGLDIAAPKGTTIYASDGGTVEIADWSGSYGKLVTINHGNGLVSYYGHCSEIYVTSGQKVAKGEKIAAVGSTGNSTGNHVHFEIRKDGTPVNPLNYLK